MTITPEKLRMVADDVVSASYELNTAAFDPAYEALRQAADEIERLRSVALDEIVALGQEMQP